MPRQDKEAPAKDLECCEAQEAALRESQQITLAILDAVPARIFWKDKNLIYLGCNAPFARDAGFSDPEEVVGKDDYQMAWRDQAELYRSDDRQVIESGRSKLLIEEPQTTPDGKVITLLTSKVPLRRRNGEIFGVLGTYLDVTERARLMETIEKQYAQFEAALANMVQGLLMYDSAGRLTVCNKRFAEIFGVPWERWKAAALGMTVSETMQLVEDWTHVALTNRPQVLAEHQNMLDRQRSGRNVFELSDGRTFSASFAPMADGGFVVTFEDITEQRRNQDQITHMAHYDALTDLPNRGQFYEKMDGLLDRAPDCAAFAVLSIDLDHFKNVNDTLGHPIGDELLRAAADRMRGCVREGDIVARLGGDEFAILQLSFGRPQDATALASRLIETVTAPYQIDDHQVVVGTSIGIAIAPGDGTVPDQLMKNADLALYRCKAEGGNAYRFFEAQMDARMQERRALEIDLRKALLNDEFVLNYQPIVSLKTGRVNSCEALIRWHQPERGLVSPLDFISVAEETGLICPIGEWVLEQACADAVAWPEDIAVAVNVSPIQFKAGNFFHVVTRALEKSGLPASRLELEITELVLMHDSNETLALLHKLKELGISIAMDDFGTGYSSIGYLRSFPFDRIKIDQSFIRDLPGSAESLAILRAVVGLGRSLHIVTTAEGVETQSQLDSLRTEGCTDVQGHIFSQPKPAAEIRELFASLYGQAPAVA